MIVALVAWLGFLPVWLRQQEWDKEDEGSLRRWAILLTVITTMAVAMMVRAFFRYA
jgi:cyanate permease